MLDAPLGSKLVVGTLRQIKIRYGTDCLSPLCNLSLTFDIIILCYRAYNGV